MGLPPSTQAAHRPQHELARASGRRGRVSHGQHVVHTRFQWPPTKQLTKGEKGRQVDLLVACTGSIQERLLLQMLHCNPSCSIWYSAVLPNLSYPNRSMHSANTNACFVWIRRKPKVLQSDFSNTCKKKNFGYVKYVNRCDSKLFSSVSPKHLKHVMGE